MIIELRAASADDNDFVYQAKKQALGPFIEQKWGWHEDYQRGVHNENWQNKPWSIILRDKDLIGTVSVDRREQAIRLGEFYIVPEYQDQGYGTQVLAGILYECDTSDRDCKIQLLKGNKAELLFRRHGFRIVETDETHCFMIRNPRVP